MAWLLASVSSLIAQASDLEGQVSLDSQVLSEIFYFYTVVVMWLIHVGFMAYEAGAARRKNIMSTAMKNILTIAVVTPSFYYFGWYIYGCLELRNGPEPRGPPERGLLPRLPPLLVDDRIDHVRGPDRARSAVGVPDPHDAPRLGGVDHGRRLGLELGRLAHDELRLPRLDRVARRPRRRRR